jgi:hypothetical protein
MTLLSFKSLYGGTYGADHFGANILATRDMLGASGTYDEAVQHLGVSTIRYPGGSLTERYFDITDPDRVMAKHYLTGGDQPLLPFSDFMAFAADTGRSVMIVLPTRTQLGQQADARGDRHAAIDEDALRDFLRATLDGVYGAPRIAGFEIGNEYWDSGQMTSVEYGRVASSMARILHEELTGHPDFDTRFSQTTINVQVGLDYGHASLSDRYSGSPQEQLAQFSAEYGIAADKGFIYGNGSVAWSKLANLLVVREFDLPEERAAVDGVIAHIYSKGESVPSSHSFELRLIDSFWKDGFDDVRPVVTEWNVRAPGRDAETDFGLVQAGEMLDMVEAMGLHDVSAAYVWAVQQGSGSTLMGDEGSPDEKLGGAFFRMMSEALPGTRAVVLQGAERQQSELALDHAEVHVFAGPEKLVLYLQSTEITATHASSVDISQLVTGFDEIRLTKLGVAPGQSPGSNRADPVVSDLDPAAHYANGILSATLAPREIVQIVIGGADLSPALSRALGLEEAAQGLWSAGMGMADPALAELGLAELALAGPGPADMAMPSGAERGFWPSVPLTLEAKALQQEAEAPPAAEDDPAGDGDDGLGFAADMLMFGLLLPLLMLAGGF